MSVSVALLKNRLSDWERLYEYELSDSDLRLWMDTMGKVNCSEAVLLEAFSLVQTKATRFPKPAHLVAAIDQARETIASRNRIESSKNYGAELEKSPHVSDIPQRERQQMLNELRKTLHAVGIETVMPDALKSDAEAKAERERQKRAFAANMSDASKKPNAKDVGAPSVAATPAASPAPSIVESDPEPYEPIDDDLPF